MELELVGSPACPYVARVQLVLLEKGVPHRVTRIDLQRPGGALAGSPLQQVPLLIIRDGRDEEVIFESAAICEFIDQVSPDGGRLMPEDPVERALVRAWSEFASACQRDMEAAWHARDETALSTALGALGAKLERLAQRVEGPFFLGDALSLADLACAPLLHSVQMLCDRGLMTWPEGLQDWWRAFWALASVQEVLGQAWQRDVDAELARRGSHIATLLA